MSFIQILLVFIVFVAISGVFSQDLASCARMDTMEKVARAACIGSCTIQNCATGYCEKRNGRPTCVCSRCAFGSNIPLDKLIKGAASAVKG
ncbi:hypothetical protein GCK72_009686 [Caenorhabditis remanei]|uniref:Uncharacterized protein n=1 Tax=Caenorhabditis remanei TaxID=31234 RepID=E3LTB3_CAERE|nr:hypothetical protein GCK72_009686 [Caenorhabditis remanei]EFP09452.1 hypothetical protein CRE_25171 [Caenorhabditis remanei]KAF1761430.1 hypothetical protein GCK72_009686 [Caenorhabditis remanei]